MVEPLSLNFRVFTVKLLGVRKFRNFMVFSISRIARVLASENTKANRNCGNCLLLIYTKDTEFHSV